jgi:hypothetical protein
MKTVATLCLVAASFLASGEVGCTPSPSPLPSASQDETQGDDGTKAKKASPSSSSSPPAARASASASPSASTPPAAKDAGVTSGSSDPPTPVSDDPGIQCMQSCLGSDATATKIFNADVDCGVKCDANDDACFTQCDKATNTACKSAGSACDTLDQCFTKCFPDNGTNNSSQ